MSSASPSTPTAHRTLAWELFLHSHAAITRTMDADLQRTSGLTLRDYEVLLYLYHAPEQGLRMSELAGRVLLTPSGITRLVQGLEASGEIVREACTQDLRVSYARLTPDGRKRFAKLREQHLNSVQELFTGRYTADELATLEQLLGKLPMTRDDCSCSATSSDQP